MRSPNARMQRLMRIRIRDFRFANGFTQEEMAEHLRLMPEDYEALENGKAEFSAVTLASTLLSLKYIWCVQKSPQRRICLKPTVTMFWRFAVPCLIFYSGPCLILYSLLGLVCAIVPAIFTVFCGPYGNLRQIEMPPYRRTTAVRKTRLIVYRRYFACKCVCALEFRLSGEVALACLYIGFEPFSII